MYRSNNVYNLNNLIGLTVTVRNSKFGLEKNIKLEYKKSYGVIDKIYYQLTMVIILFLFCIY